MTITAFTSPVSGIWPLGMITVGASGTPACTASATGSPSDLVMTLTPLKVQ